MPIDIADPVWQTLVFGFIFLSLLLLSIRKISGEDFFSERLTTEMKGFAILAVVFSHIGYFLSNDHRFLYPFSVLAGVGVNLFLFWSGFGLTSAQLKNNLSVVDFYKKRLKKLFLPMWAVITLLFIADFIFLGKIYPLAEIIRSYFGFFPRADIWINPDSPLWYFTMIFFFYLIFPLTFWKKMPYLCPFSMVIISYILLSLTLPIDPAVLSLYKVHSLSFPLGVMLAVLSPDLPRFFRNNVFKILLVCLFLIVAGYTSINSGVGTDKNIEQTVSLITMFSLVFIFMLKNIEFRLFTYFGVFSYTIYLIHWPVLSRYGLLFKFLPAWFATIVYLGMFLGIGYLISKITFLGLKVRRSPDRSTKSLRV